MSLSPEPAPEEEKEEQKKQNDLRFRKVTNQQLWEELQKLNVQLNELKLSAPKDGPNGHNNSEDLRRLNDQLSIIKVQIRSLSDQLNAIDSKLNAFGIKGDNPSRRDSPHREYTAMEPPKDTGVADKTEEQDGKKKWWQIGKK